MGTAYLYGNGGSGGGLNFKLVGGTTEPANPKENLIWIKTDVAISGYSFSEAAPSEPTEGMVWIKVGFSSIIAFNALKKNCVQVYPVSVKQYIDGAWEGMTADISQGGQWKPFYDGYLGSSVNNLGEPSFVVLGSGGNCTLSTKTFTQNEDGSFTVEMKNSGSGETSWMNAACCFPEKLDLKDVNTITIQYIVEAYRLPSSGVVVYLRVNESPTSGASLATQTIISHTTAKNTLITKNVDVSGVDGGYLRIFHNFANMAEGGSYFKIKIIDISPS